MKTFQDYLIEEIAAPVKAAIHPDLHKGAKALGSSGASLTVKKSQEQDVKDKLHAHLSSNGYKRNPVLSDHKAATYAHADGSKIHVTHYPGRSVIEHEK